MADLGFKLDCIWNILKSKLLSTLVRDFLNKIIRSTKTLPNLGHTFWWQPTQKDMEEETLFLPDALMPTGNFVYPGASANIKSTSSRFRCRPV